MKKKILFLTLLVGGGIFLSHNVLALSFDPVSPSPGTVPITINCISSGDYIFIFNPDETYASEYLCPLESPITWETDIGADGVYSIVECALHCDSNETYTAIQEDPNFLTSSLYTIDVSAGGSDPEELEFPTYVAPTESGEGEITYFDWLIMNGFIVFLLSLIVLHPVIKSLYSSKS